MIIKSTNNDVEGSSMWQEFLEPQTVKYSDTVTQTWEKQGIQREDGFTLIAEKMMVEDKLQTYICRSGFGEFRFYAHRWNISEDKPLDTYTVLVNTISSDWNIDKETHKELVLKNAKDIESALLAFPLSKTLNTPVKEVFFNISKNPKVPVLIRAEEI